MFIRPGLLHSYHRMTLWVFRASILTSPERLVLHEQPPRGITRQLRRVKLFFPKNDAGRPDLSVSDPLTAEVFDDLGACLPHRTACRIDEGPFAVGAIKHGLEQGVIRCWTARRRRRMADALELTRRYFADLERGLTGDALAAYYDPAVIQEEFPQPPPSRTGHGGIWRHHPGRRRERGQRAMAGAALRDPLHRRRWGSGSGRGFRWTGTLAVPLYGSLPARAEMRGRFASFLEFRNGRIIAQRSYADCFEPW